MSAANALFPSREEVVRELSEANPAAFSGPSSLSAFSSGALSSSCLSCSSFLERTPLALPPPRSDSLVSLHDVASSSSSSFLAAEDSVADVKQRESTGAAQQQQTLPLKRSRGRPPMGSEERERRQAAKKMRDAVRSEFGQPVVYMLYQDAADGWYVKIGQARGDFGQRLAAHHSSCGWYQVGLVAMVEDAAQAEAAWKQFFVDWMSDEATPADERPTPAPYNHESWLVPAAATTLRDLQNRLFTKLVNL